MLAHLIRIGLGLFFLIVALLKAADPGEFERLVGDFGIVPDVLVSATAILLIVLEVLAGILLIVGTRAGLALAAGLLVLFAGALVYGLALGLDVECGCLGIGARGADGGNLASALARDLVLLGLLGLVHGLERRRRREGWEDVDPGPPGGGESRP